MAQTLPSTCKALVCHAVGQPLKIESVPIPEAVTGSVVVRVLASPVQPNHKEVLDGNIPYLQYPIPRLPGSSGVGRVTAVGPDTTSLKVGQLVLTECFIRGRDDPNIQILWLAPSDLAQHRRSWLQMYGAMTYGRNMLGFPWRIAML